jgi:hypothetical protein
MPHLEYLAVLLANRCVGGTAKHHNVRNRLEGAINRPDAIFECRVVWSGDVVILRLECGISNFDRCRLISDKGVLVIRLACHRCRTSDDGRYHETHLARSHTV